ncbi:phage tail protein [Pseudoduganella sp. DS3]|uniref:Phage tail protein n=1 Tax=Pseudoduganella guangdongensis TaxID=2692179 RepID=A0A6N9HNQ0_9BURK|nr:tail fiber protein [Pseudoduganella guangdongensis]MYN04452.1 phage tail protein [Pseudoduganella guangdongensis]
MSDPFVGEIRMFGGNFAPNGWALCDGQLLPISEYETLFNLIGTTYGGDGQSTFALPNMQSRVPLHVGSLAGYTFQLGEMAGVEEVTLNTTQIPSHSHPVLASTERGSGVYSNLTGYPAATVGAGSGVYGLSDGGTQAMAVSAIAGTGGSQPHTNMAPYTCVNFIISLYGAFPIAN